MTKARFRQGDAVTTNCATTAVIAASPAETVPVPIGTPLTFWRLAGSEQEGDVAAVYVLTTGGTKLRLLLGELAHSDPIKRRQAREILGSCDPNKETTTAKSDESFNGSHETGPTSKASLNDATHLVADAIVHALLRYTESGLADLDRRLKLGDALMRKALLGLLADAAAYRAERKKPQA